MTSDLLAVFGAKVTGARNIVELLDVQLPQLMPGFTLQILEDCELPNDYARTYPESSLMQVRESVYEGARSGNPRDRFTLAHELGHLFLHQGVTAYARSENSPPHKVYEDSEWQADTYAAEFLMPMDEVKSIRSHVEIMLRFNVSEMAAQRRFRAIKKR
ncbi:ImmA/IrrE family metallo-endopeptidase [Cellvibrio mixtus]|uniref:ImmA/IrrE family metallo-endopeptidase n=1 Tax=Cellvibrio mixtus TaxID=39650 RepID=UPI000693B771|nr:ImmA/IrrE family metallo-endopeptidase [Cellvibrio mixtus]